MVIFLNGVLQDPGVSYTFDGGTSFSFSIAPKPEDKLISSSIEEQEARCLQVDNVAPTLEKGDTVRFIKMIPFLEQKHKSRVVLIFRSQINLKPVCMLMKVLMR